jgi:hypothetical protein
MSNRKTALLMFAAPLNQLRSQDTALQRLARIFS